MQTFIFGRNKGRCMRKEHLGNFLQGSIRLAEPERRDTAAAHVATAVSQKFRSPAAHSGNPQISEWRRKRVSLGGQSPAQQRYFRSIKSRWAQAEPTSSPVSLRFEYWSWRAGIGSNLISFRFEHLRSAIRVIAIAKRNIRFLSLEPDRQEGFDSKVSKLVISD